MTETFKGLDITQTPDLRLRAGVIGGSVKIGLAAAIIGIGVGVGLAGGYFSFTSIMTAIRAYDKFWGSVGSIFGALINGLTPGIDVLHHSDKTWNLSGRWFGRSLPVFIALATWYNARGITTKK